MTNITLFSPGPTPLSKECLLTLSTPPLHHRSKEFKKIVKETIELLGLLFDEKHKLAFCSTGTGALEASVVNFMSSGDVAITLDGGKFGERWSEILEAYKINHHNNVFKWGDTPDLKEVELLLEKYQPKALFMQACETSTGTKYDIQAISSILKTKSPDTLLVVDGVTAVGAYPLSMIENNIDVLITGSQKSLGLPTGLSLMGLSDKAVAAAKNSDLPKYYFNILKELESLNSSTTKFSSPTQIWTALNLELKKLKQDSLETQFKNCEKLQSMILEWAKSEELDLFSTAPSPSLTALNVPKGVKASDIQSLLLKEGFYIATGQAQFKEQIVRIGHMKNITEAMMKEFLLTFSKVLRSLKQ